MTVSQSRFGELPGVTKAREAATAVDGRVAIPPNRGDFNDMEKTQGGEAVASAIGEAKPIDLSPDEEVARLAKLSPLEYDRVREDRAKRLNVRIGTLDKEVAKAQGNKDDSIAGVEIDLPEIALWPHPVTGSEILDEVRSHILRHMVIDAHQATAITLWVAHVHLFARFSHSPRLLITAPDAECGKTLLMTHIVGAMIPKPIETELMKAAPFFRLASALRPSFLIDEMDVFIQQDSDLLAAVNNGWEPHGGVLRCVGDQFEVRHFSTFTPVVMAGIDLHSKLPATTVSRSIVVSLERATEDELDEDDIYETRRHRVGIKETARRLARWCADAGDEIARCSPALPQGVRNRMADKWRPLFAIAEVAGGKWPEMARNALIAQPNASKPSKALQLLIDIHEVMKGEARNIATETLIRSLADSEESLWADYNFRQRDPEDRRIQPRQLAALLGRYGIKSMPVRPDGWNKPARGYRKGDLERVWSRYLPKTPPEKALQRYKLMESTTCSDSMRYKPESDVTDRKPREPSNYAGCNAVTDTEGVATKEEGISDESPPSKPGETRI